MEKVLPDSSANLQTSLTPIARLMRLNQGVQQASRGIFYSGFFLIAVFALSKFIVFPSWVFSGSLILAALSILTLFVLAWWRGPTLADAARLVDRTLGLKERLSTVLELDERRVESEVASVLRHEAAQHLDKIKSKKLVSIRIPKGPHWIVLPMALAGLIAALPEYKADEKRIALEEKKTIQAQGEKIELLVRRLTEKSTVANMGIPQEELKKVEEIGRKLSSGELSKSDALRELTKLTDELKKTAQTLSPKDGAKPLDPQSQRERQSMSPEQVQAIQKQVESLQEKLGKSPPSEKQLQKMEQALQQAKEMAKDAKAGSQEGEALSQALDQLMQQAKANNLPELESDLQKAIQSLQNSETSQVVQNLDEAMIDLNQLKQQLASMKHLMQQAAKAGKDLAEQLEKGQTKLAQKTLQDFQQKLKDGKLNEQQQQQIAQELQKALPPSKPYGDQLSQQMQKACEQCKSGDQKGLSQSLQEAIDSLSKAGQQQEQQMQMAEMMQEIDKINQSMGSGQCNSGKEGEIQGFGLAQNGPPKAGDGKGPGGVGTWTEDGQGSNLPVSPSWDNTGIDRPDMVPKGQSDRGDVPSPKDTKTMKINGTMGTGGPMPGIRLPGVYIKGQSHVKMEESFSSAAQEAESAMTKETVPATHQNTVKDYFDLK